MLGQYNGAHPVLIGIPYPIIYEVPQISNAQQAMELPNYENVHNPFAPVLTPVNNGFANSVQSDGKFSLNSFGTLARNAKNVAETVPTYDDEYLIDDDLLSAYAQ